MGATFLKAYTARRPHSAATTAISQNHDEHVQPAVRSSSAAPSSGTIIRKVYGECYAIAAPRPS